MANRWLMGMMVMATVMPLVAEVMAEEAKPLRFAIQGDLHNFRRVPESYLRRMLADAKDIGCAFIAFLGDIFNGTKENPMRLSKESPLPILWVKGDHEFFGEWGRTSAVRLSQRHPLAGETPDPLVFFRGALPRFEALTGQPTAWAFTLHGIFFRHPTQWQKPCLARLAAFLAATTFHRTSPTHDHLAFPSDAG